LRPPFEKRVRRLVEALGQQRLGQHRSTLALGVPAHAITGNQQRGLLRDHDRDPILVRLARAEQTDLCVFDPQASSRPFG
jgi:hypothetical protein